MYEIQSACCFLVRLVVALGSCKLLCVARGLVFAVVVASARVRRALSCRKASRLVVGAAVARCELPKEHNFIDLHGRDPSGSECAAVARLAWLAVRRCLDWLPCRHLRAVLAPSVDVPLLSPLVVITGAQIIFLKFNIRSTERKNNNGEDKGSDVSQCPVYLMEL